MTAPWFETRLPTILSNYSLADIYNADEFGLFYQALPSKTMHFKDEKCVGGKFSKQRLTGLAAGNALGQKLSMFIIGKANKPRCFKNLKHLPCHYTEQKKSWMDSDLFEEWVREQDRKFECEDRKILLIVDNCPAHPQIGGLKAIKMCFLPPDATSITQPIDQGVIRSLKAQYRSRMIQQIIKAIDAKKSILKVNVLDAMKMLTISWENVTQETVEKCFVKSHISPQDQTSAQDDLDNPFIELRNDLEKLKSLGVDKYPEEVSPETFASFDDTVAATEPVLSDESILAMVREIEEAIEVEDDEDDGGHELISLEEPTSIQLRSAIETLLDFSFFTESDEVQRCTLKVSKLIEKELSQSLQQASTKDYFS